MTIKTLEYIHNLLLIKVNDLQFEYQVAQAQSQGNVLYKEKKFMEAKKALEEFESECWV